MVDPARTASRTKKKKKTTSSPLIEAPVQSQDAKDAKNARARGGAFRRSDARGSARKRARVYLAPLASSGVLAVSSEPYS